MANEKKKKKENKTRKLNNVLKWPQLRTIGILCHRWHLHKVFHSIPFPTIRFRFNSINRKTMNVFCFTNWQTDGRTDMFNMHCFGSVINIYLLVVLALWIWSKWTKKLTKQMVLMSLGCLKPQFKAVVWDRKKKQNHVRWYLEHQPSIWKDALNVTDTYFIVQQMS